MMTDGPLAAPLGAGPGVVVLVVLDPPPPPHVASTAAAITAAGRPHRLTPSP
jgi:hypothetical protein